MFAVMSNAKQAYSTVAVETGIESADPHQLVLMLFDGALLSVSSASLHMQRKEIAQKGEAVSRAINIIANGLKASLNMDVGGDLAEKLSALYDYMCSRLLQANLHNSPAMLEEVSHLLAELKSAWETIADAPEVKNVRAAAAA